MGGRLTDGRPVARPGQPPQRRPAPPRRIDRSRRGRLRRFVRRHGWRAYAIPVLAVATVAVLVDLVLNPPGATPTAPAAGGTSAPAAPTTTGGAAAGACPSSGWVRARRSTSG
ncbi:hypothetical protein E9529_13575 [Blastococcus sp. KM273128]|uniref:hypothetical protein n=1 Tax=Blastococcus sp. KM273128 TaxID=2570314 RepID=UPI001F3B9259|nr:hypothetical protein [Blastococcus sp. KM273128]MCF6745284.1 hypothetical protein [Blastococcus sp. KM273128]